MTTRRFLIRALLLAALPLATGPALAQPAWPTKPIRLIVASAPGGSIDFIGRLIGPKLATVLGQPVVIDNKAGAAGNLATELAARAPADGYTLLLTATSHSTNLNLYSKLSYDPVKDFAPISQINNNLFGLVVPAASPVSNFSQFLALARSSGSKLNYASAGSGQANHLGTELLKTQAGFDAVHVPFKSMGDATTALLGNQVDFAIMSLSSVLGQAKAGKLKILAITSQKRSAILPGVPTISEAGVPGYELSGWQGLLAPAGTPREIVERLHQEIAKIMKQPDVLEKVAGISTEPVGSSPQEFEKFIQSEILKWEKVIRQSGARAD